LIFSASTRAASDRAAFNGASDGAASDGTTQAEKINALQQKAIPTDEDGQGKVAEDKEEGSQPEAESVGISASG
jgi:hypothetical protein